MIDLHCHILPGIDDGPRTIEQTIEMARVAALAGTTTIVATSHVSMRYPNDAATLLRLAEEVGARLAAEGIPMRILSGAEVAMTRVLDVDDEDLVDMRLGRGPWLLLEPPFTPAIAGFDLVVADLQRKGHRIVLAHPERCPAFHADPDALRTLVNAGVLSSITAGSLVGRFGKTVERLALRFVQEGLAHNVASDAHDAYRRGPDMASELRQAGLGELAGWLTRDVPAAILEGGEIPERPLPAREPQEPARARRWLRRA